MEPGDDFFLKQEAELTRFEDRRVERFLMLLDQARRSLNAEIRGYEFGSDKSRIKTLIEQVDAIEQDLQQNLKHVPKPIEALTQLVINHQNTTLGLITEIPAGIKLTGATIPRRFLEQLAEYNFAKVTSLTKKQFDDLRSSIFTRIGIKGESPRKVATALTGTDGVFPQPFYIVETILRTETNTLYNEMRLSTLQEANRAHNIGLNKIIKEQMNIHRNHPISRVINQQVQPADQPFKAKISDILAAATTLRTPKGKQKHISVENLNRSVFWEKKGDSYEGQNLPAHYGERGIVVPTTKAVTPV